MRRVLPAGVSLCPRCGGYIPNNEQPGAYPGALSRLDNETEICSACGQAEALEDFLGPEIMPKEFWQANIRREFLADVREMQQAEDARKTTLIECEHLELERANCEECAAHEVECTALICVACSEIIETEES